ncbi:dendrin-like [Narcine bancroftii]|uniref:dendrin-like n=1 Tax=Narcine bancroftii TaxID=1343680 RepID=UPI00383223F7
MDLPPPPPSWPYELPVPRRDTGTYHGQTYDPCKSRLPSQIGAENDYDMSKNSAFLDLFTFIFTRGCILSSSCWEEPSSPHLASGRTQSDVIARRQAGEAPSARWPGWSKPGTQPVLPATAQGLGVHWARGALPSDGPGNWHGEKKRIQATVGANFGHGWNLPAPPVSQSRQRQKVPTLLRQPIDQPRTPESPRGSSRLTSAPWAPETRRAAPFEPQWESDIPVPPNLPECKGSALRAGKPPSYEMHLRMKGEAEPSRRKASFTCPLEPAAGSERGQRPRAAPVAKASSQGRGGPASSEVELRGQHLHPSGRSSGPMARGDPERPGELAPRPADRSCRVDPRHPKGTCFPACPGSASGAERWDGGGPGEARNRAKGDLRRGQQGEVVFCLVSRADPRGGRAPTRPQPEPPQGPLAEGWDPTGASSGEAVRRLARARFSTQRSHSDGTPSRNVQENGPFPKSSHLQTEPASGGRRRGVDPGSPPQAPASRRQGEGARAEGCQWDRGPVCEAGGGPLDQDGRGRSWRWRPWCEEPLCSRRENAQPSRTRPFPAGAGGRMGGERAGGSPPSAGVFLIDATCAIVRAQYICSPRKERLRFSPPVGAGGARGSPGRGFTERVERPTPGREGWDAGAAEWDGGRGQGQSPLPQGTERAARTTDANSGPGRRPPAPTVSGDAPTPTGSAGPPEPAAEKQPAVRPGNAASGWARPGERTPGGWPGLREGTAGDGTREVSLGPRPLGPGTRKAGGGPGIHPPAGEALQDAVSESVSRIRRHTAPDSESDEEVERLPGNPVVQPEGEDSASGDSTASNTSADTVITAQGLGEEHLEP